MKISPLHHQKHSSALPQRGHGVLWSGRLRWWWRCSVRLLLPLTVSGLMSCVTINYGSIELQQADRFFREGRYEDAIAAYRNHMQKRLEVANRPRWENPYFYLLLIGDAHLGKDDPFTALESYQEAERHNVSETLISDRYRAVARWYEQRGELTAALALLRRFRDRDSLLFDAMLDRVARSLTAKEDAERQAAAAKNSTTRDGSARGGGAVRVGSATPTPSAPHGAAATPTPVGTAPAASAALVAAATAEATDTTPSAESPVPVPVAVTPSAGADSAGNTPPIMSLLN